MAERCVRKAKTEKCGTEGPKKAPAPAKKEAGAKK